jgi:hypothetical protein
MVILSPIEYVSRGGTVVEYVSAIVVVVVVLWGCDGQKVRSPSPRALRAGLLQVNPVTT